MPQMHGRQEFWPWSFTITSSDGRTASTSFMRWGADSEDGHLRGQLNQELARNVVRGIIWPQTFLMTLTHCPLCLGLALLSAFRTTAHLVMIFQLERRNADQFEQSDRSLDAIFEY